jgi:hypothetical protein
MFRHPASLLALLLPLMCLTARAEGIDPYGCRNASFPSEGAEAALYRVVSARPLHFHDDDKGCPQAAGCRRAAYVVDGDEVLVSKVQHGWACAWYQGKQREFVGWVLAEALVPVGEPAVALTDWIGAWQGAAGSIDIAPGQRGALEVAGTASWGSGAHVHVGEMAGVIRPAGRHAKLGENAAGCMVEFDRVGRYLIARDNRRCGGVNVTFDDVYVRK